MTPNQVTNLSKDFNTPPQVGALMLFMPNLLQGLDKDFLNKAINKVQKLINK